MPVSVKDVAASPRVQKILIGWLPPILLGAYAFAIAVLPDVRDSAAIDQIAMAVRLLGVNKYLFLLVACLTLAAFLHLSRTFWYKLLEGELWPYHLREWRRARAHRPHQRYLLAKQQHSRAVAELATAEQALSSAEDDQQEEPRLAELRAALDRAKDAEERTHEKLDRADDHRHYRGRKRKYPRGLGWLPRRRRPLFTPADWTKPDSPDWIPTYPAREDQVMPTRIGNELKAMETYGVNTIGLDSQILWYELYSEAAQPLREVIDDSELRADTFVCAIYVALGFTTATIAGAIWEWTSGHLGPKLWLTAAIGLLVLPLLHRGLLAAIDEWAAGIRALVNNGRITLIQKYGLRDPENRAEEREMWQALTGFIYYAGAPYYAEKLDAFRRPSECANPQDAPSGKPGRTC